MTETAGLVLVEPDVTDLEPKAMQDKDHAANAGGIAELRKCRDAVAAGTSNPDPACADFFFRGLPEPKFSPELNAALLNLVQSKVAVYDAALAEWEQMPQTEAWLQQHSSRFSFPTAPSMSNSTIRMLWSVPSARFTIRAGTPNTRLPEPARQSRKESETTA